MYKILGTDNKEYGPVSADQLRQWILEGRANRSTLIQAEGATSWKPLSLFPEFSATLGNAPPTQPAARPVAAATTGTNGMAIASLVSGIASFPGLVCCCGPTLVSAPLGIVFGIIALVQLKSRPQQTGQAMAWAGIALSGVSIVLLVVLMLLGVFAEQIEKWFK